MSSRETAIVDFETEGTELRPDYPPKPVGVALTLPGQRPRYLAWGHPEGNNCTFAQGRAEVRRIWATKLPVAFHNASFDMDIAETHLGCPELPPDRVHDTMVLAYLFDPRMESISLKSLAEQLLSEPPEEQDKLREWILANVPEAKRKPSEWAAYICRAPVRIVGPYAIGDVVRTKRLLAHFLPWIRKSRMLGAYEREIRVLRAKLRMERGGALVDRRALARDADKLEQAATGAEKYVRRSLRVGDDVNLGSADQLADALKRAGKVRKFVMTEKGNRSVSREALEQSCLDKELTHRLIMRSVIRHQLDNFFYPWLARSERDGHLHTTFHTTRDTGERGAGGRGTRTGRLSSTNPNLQAVTAVTDESKNAETMLKVAKFLESYGVRGWLGMRDYIVPPPGCVILSRDYDQQELRVYAHWEEGLLLREYLENPKLDVHQWVSDYLRTTLGMDLPRKFVKIIVFAIIYGRGVRATAEQLGVDEQKARELIQAIYKALPGLKDINEELRRVSRRNEPIRTLGGRLYWTEKPRVLKKGKREGQLVTFEYRLLNLLIQGSSADVTKEAMIALIDDPYASLRIQIHDELFSYALAGERREASEAMRAAMETLPNLKLKVPMTTTGKWSDRSWARLRKDDVRKAA